MPEQDWVVEDALNTYPLAPVPAGFRRRVMIHIRAEASARPVNPPAFRLEFLDLALPFFFALFSALLLAGALWACTAIDPLVLLEARLTLQVLASRLPLGQILVILSALAGLGVFGLGLIACLALWRSPVQTRVRLRQA